MGRTNTAMYRKEHTISQGGTMYRKVDNNTATIGYLVPPGW